MDQLDALTIQFLNQVVNQFEALDRFMVHLKGNNLVKGGVLLSLYWWAWFSTERAISGKAAASSARRTVIASFVGSSLAVVAARGLSLLVPNRQRPAHDADSGFLAPVGSTQENLSAWSSFPSDHAAVFVGLAFGLVLLSRRLGLVAMGYVVVFVLLPRLYTGLHYLSDIAAGAILGLLCVGLMNHHLPKRLVGDMALGWMQRHRPSFYAALFLLTFQIGTLFDGARNAAAYLAEMLKLTIG